ncbi:DNA transfer protein [Candidatus Arsenophonus triatominarum]|uniref:DNA transfer protein n=1 Tax=Candidatus Arsenophonus triatominarum TaxID=57911 RepID=UPI001FDF3A00|nr:DNA transfer protein [Candidatus Arsenophonus triatominarum]
MKSFGAAYAANDRDAMKQLAVAHPEQIERIQKGMGFIDQDRNQVMDKQPWICVLLQKVVINH